MLSDMESDDKLAIVGTGCRMPPTANSLQAFWRFLIKGGDALRSVKSARWDWRRFYDEDQDRPGKTYAPKMAMLEQDIRTFDPGAFGISPREAAFLDPQQRLLLEVTWEALEDAGIPLSAVSGSRTGVFIGAFCIDHLVNQVQPANRHLVSSHSTVGASMTIISNRISHAFNLRGPSLTLDTACSSSLVAFHYACQSVRSGESDMAIAGGVNVMTRPEYPVMMSKGHFLSYHGECRAFDETAAGYTRGEGAGVVLIKKLSRALADGDTIHAVVRGSAVNQDGRTDGISLPNSIAQRELLDSLYTRCAVASDDMDYIEAHGTGTQAGDAAETAALNAHFSKGRTSAKKLLVGSVKSNIGHLEAAAGMAGIFKALGILKARQVPKNLHFNTPNPKIPFDDYCLQVVAEATKLPTPQEKETLRVGVNSFGYGGTNAHAILESAPIQAPVKSAPTPDKLKVIPFSANSEKALRDLAGKLAFQLGQSPAPTLDDVAYTAAHRRSHLDFRYAAVVENLAQLREMLIAASTGQPQPMLAEGSVERDPKGLVFVYTGMGPQWWAMGQELIREIPLVSDTIDEIDVHFKKLSGWSLREAMMASEKDSRMERTEVAQTANFALQVALTRLWKTYGIEPAAVVGHSVGEVSSAYVAGVYSLEDAVRVSYHRSRVQQKMAGQGAMLAVGLPEADALKLIAGVNGVSVAAINSFSAVTLSGDKEALEQLAARLEKDGVFHRFLRVEVAYHSPQMDPLREELLEVLAPIVPHPPTLPIYSTAFGSEVPYETWDAHYWWVNVRESVRFADAIKVILQDGYSGFLEVGPHPVLGNSIKECAAHLGKRVRCHISLKRKEPEFRTLLVSLGDLYCAGRTVDWSAFAPASARFLPAPAYPWQRQKHWVESERGRIDLFGNPGPVYLDTPLEGPGARWEVEVNRNYFPFLFEHRVQDQAVFAGMGYVEAAITAAQRLYGSRTLVLENVSFEKVLIVDYSKLQYLITALDPIDGRFAVSSRVDGEEDSVLRHCRGRVWPQNEAAQPTLDMAALREKCAVPVEKDAFYDKLARRGLHYGPAFRPTADIRVGEDCFLVRIDAGAMAGEEYHPLHPTIYDAAVQPVLYCAGGERLFVPFLCEKITYYGKPGEECYAYGEVHRQTDTAIFGEIWLLDPEGRVLAQMSGAICQLIETEIKADALDLYYETTWKRTAALETSEPVDGSRILVLGDGAKIASEIPGAITGELSNAPDRDRIIVVFDLSSDLLAPVGRVVAILQQIIQSREQRTDVTIVTTGARAVLPDDHLTNLPAYPLGVVGLVAQNENDFLTVRSLDFPSLDGIAPIIAAEIAAGGSGDFAYRNGERFESVLDVYDSEANARKYARTSLEEPVALRVGAKGHFDEIHFEPAARSEPAEGEIEIRVHRAAINHEDLLKIEGRLHPAAEEATFNGSAIGMECAGVVVKAGPGSAFSEGDRVVALGRDCFRSYATVREIFTTKIPHAFSMDAAGIPVVFLAAYRGLVDIAHLRKGERVLIHSATGGLGAAAISIARKVGAEIFATAGTDEKRESLRAQGITHVYSSRDLNFGEAIRRDTAGEGIDVVFGALTGQAMQVSLGALRAGGRYIEAGKKDIAEDAALPLAAFQKNLIFASVDIDRMLKAQPSEVRRLLDEIFTQFADGSLVAPASTTIPAIEAPAAFRELAHGSRSGKQLIDFSSGEVPVLQTGPESVVRNDGAYLVTGGTSGFGLVTGQWLAAKGAGKIYLASRSGSKAAGMEAAIAEIEAHGSQLEIVSLDVSDSAQVSDFIHRAAQGPVPLRGIIHGAMVLDDGLMADMTPDRLDRVLRPKVVGAQNLAASAKDLDFLVFYSSISSVIGNRGQTNYVAANALLDGYAAQLRSQGIPAVSINWGALGEVGVVARDEHLEKVLAASGIVPLTNAQALGSLELALRSGLSQLGVFGIEWDKFQESQPRLAADPRFRELCIKAGKAAGGGVAEELRQSLAPLSKEERLSILEGYLQEVLAGTLRTATENVPLNRKINELGVDSLMVLELSLGIKERIGITFTAMEFLKGPSLQQLAQMVETRLWSY